MTTPPPPPHQPAETAAETGHGPLMTERRGLNRRQAAAYINVGVTKFDEMVNDGRMPQPKKIDGRVVWDRWALDEAFAALPDREVANPWDQP